MSNLPFEDDGQTICYCMGVSAFEIKKAIYEKHLKTVPEVVEETRAGGGCMSCHSQIEQLIDEVWSIINKE